MPLFEIVLRFPDRDEVRIADRDVYEPGAQVVIASRTYVVAGTESPQGPNVSERFVLRPSDE